MARLGKHTRFALFYAYAGPGPFVCRICKKEVDTHFASKARPGSAAYPMLHHKDGNNQNEVYENLELLHGGCHLREHALEQYKRGKVGWSGVAELWKTSEYRKKMSEKFKAAWARPETRARHVAAQKRFKETKV